jgi:multidrug resistance efflux pump
VLDELPLELLQIDREPLAGDPFGGAVLRELRIKEGQTVKRDEIIGVLSNYPAAEVAVKIAENDLAKFVMHREKVLKGQRLTDIALEADALKSAIENDRLKKMLRVRSGTPVAEKELDSSIAEQNLQIQRASLELSKRRLQIELEQNELTIERLKAARDSALRTREEALIRSPIDGVVTQINSRQGEIASGAGIAKIVDMTQLRVFATVDELHLHRLKPGAPVQITFRGSPTVYMGKIAIAPMTVKRTKRSEADLGEANVRQVEVEIQAEDGVTLPQMLGREARVTFL